MDKATLTMLENLPSKTGRTLEEWKEILKTQSFTKHGEVMSFLKSKHGLTHGYADLIAHKSKGSDAASANEEDLLVNQYVGKENLKPFYEKLAEEIQKFGNDIEFSPKKAYVSVRRKKQFVTLEPLTKTRFEIGFNLKGLEAKGKLLAEKPGAMCSHRIKLVVLNEIDQEVIDWLKIAYDNAG
jgi:hypothetical protein